MSSPADSFTLHKPHYLHYVSEFAERGGGRVGRVTNR